MLNENEIRGIMFTAGTKSLKALPFSSVSGPSTNQGAGYGSFTARMSGSVISVPTELYQVSPSR